ncbi:MAG: hypothetical protein H5U10_01560 [Desulfacinum sp.]|nr:hypothetical protein [Desulfacinum sp.]
MNARQKGIVIAMDLLLLAELCLCMYWGAARGEMMAAFFIRSFLPMALVTVIGARFCIRRCRSVRAAGPREG